MMLYLIFAIMVLAVLAFLVWPLIRKKHLYLAICLIILLPLGTGLLYACFGSPTLTGVANDP